METVALIASLVSIALAFFAIWQANHHRDQSDKLNRDTTEKLARIEAFATSTKEDAFKELERWGDFARGGGKALEEAEKAKDEEIRKLKDEIQAMTQTEINKVLQTVESKINSSTGTSTISEIKKEFEEFKMQIGKIQEKAVAGVEDAEKKTRIATLLARLSPVGEAILVKIAENPGWTTYEYLQNLGYDDFPIRQVVARVELYGLLRERTKLVGDRCIIIDFQLDEDLKRALLE